MRGSTGRGATSASRRLAEPEHPRLDALDPAIFAARRLAHGDRRTLFEIECRVLSRQSCHQIARCSHEDSETILAYEHVFYDMRSRLDAEDAVLCAIQRPERLPFTRVDLEAMIRVVAYCGGPFLLEPALRYYDEKFHASRVAGKPDPTPTSPRDFADQVELHIWSIDPANSLALLAMYDLMLRAERANRPEAAALVRPLLGFAGSGLPGDLATPAAPAGPDADPDEHGGGLSTAGDLDDEPEPPAMARAG